MQGERYHYPSPVVVDSKRGSDILPFRPFKTIAAASRWVLLRNWIIRLILPCFLISSVISADPFRELGALTKTNGMTWDHADTNVIGYNIFLSETNVVAFSKVATVTTNRWAGDTTRNWFGKKLVYITAFTARGEESGPSETVIVPFRAGVPMPPNNIGIYFVIQAPSP